MEVYFGADYYPEHWRRERWETDARLMRDMGLDVVRMAEFSWLEPSIGAFDFGWLDDAIELLARYGIKAVLGTPTAAPPAWIINENPEIQPIDSHGHRHHFGGRHHCCQSNPAYREHIRRYVTAFASHFGQNPNVLGWQIDNELGNSHADLCFCPSCENRFRLWLEDRYGDVVTLNKNWGTAFWSQNYSSFSQVRAPKLTAAGVNPSQMLDWKRFHSDLIVEFHAFQAKILRAASPEKFITHNMMGFADTVSYFDLGKDLDFASQDQYPGGHFHPGGDTSWCASISADLDLIRAVKGKPFWIMEQQSGITGWETMSRAPKPGQLAMWAAHSVAHCADTVVFFRWRTCTVGTEQYWHGILPHSGVPGRNYSELRDFIAKTKPLLREVRGAMPDAKAGIVFSYDQKYALDIQPNSPELTYRGQIMKYYNALYKRNIAVDFVPESGDFEKYSLLIAPLQYIMTPELEQKYRSYVQSGGTLVLTMRSGVKDSSNICVSDRPLPGLLAELAGIEISEYDCLRGESGCTVWDDTDYGCEKWCDIITPVSASTLARYGSEFYSGTPAVTKNSFGGGTVYYVGTEPCAELADRLMREFTARLGLPCADTPGGVEVTRRVLGGREYIFVINHTGEEQTVNIPQEWAPYFAGQTERLKPYAADVYTVSR